MKSAGHMLWGTDLIDTLWNVKSKMQGCNIYRRGDLIDTLWNVKSLTMRRFRVRLFDLIDTLWNVKMQLMQQMFSGDPGFNRYIVECKAGCKVIKCVLTKI